MKARNAIELCGLWEQLNNHNFKSIEFDIFKNEPGFNGFALIPQNGLILPKQGERNRDKSSRFQKNKKITCPGKVCRLIIPVLKTELIFVNCLMKYTGYKNK